MYTKEQQLAQVEEILGSPLPELDPVYWDGVKVYAQQSPNVHMLPYLLSEVYTKEEMAMVNLLPATAQEVAEKLNLNPAHAEKVLSEMELHGKIIASNVANPRVYAPHQNSVAFRDSIGTGLLAYGLDWMPMIKAFKLMDKWIKFEYHPDIAKRLNGDMRVIPKYESIKDLPGVMYCENMKEIMERNVRANTMVTAQCVCRTYKSYIDLGRYDPDYCKDNLNEHGSSDGHCFSFNRQAEFFASKHNVYHPTMEEAMERLKEADLSRAIYMTPNTRDTTYVCTCCTDCCAVNAFEEVGYKDIRKPSRFRPTVREGLCVGCETCVGRCNYEAIHIEDGRAVVREDLCKGCGNCVVTCPTNALKMKIVHDPDWIPDVPYVDGWSVHDELEEK